MTKNSKKLSGVFAPVVTPFVNDKVELQFLKENLQKLGQSELTGYLALGSNGEYKSLTDSEQIEVLEVFTETKGDKVIMVGTGCESTFQTIEKSKIAAQMGFDYVSVLTPHYFGKRMDGPTLKDYFLRIADSIEIPVLLYNAPGFANGVTIPPQVVKELSKHPNIVGMKDSAPTGPVKFLSVLDPDEDFSVLAGSANFFYPSLHLGATGGTLSTANAVPEVCCKLYDLFVQGEFEQAKDLHNRISRLNQAISGSWGVAGVKAAMDICGFKGGLPRHPLKQINEEGIEKIKQSMRDEGI
ncbi:MAG: dihydrodipicolinate synthase family protein [Sedimentisphaerales bacterium]|nr:dihydrodipicolinate synthase family protein [Sedimentisphaerales bacterium]